MRRSFQCAPERGIIADMNRDDIERKIADHGIETVKIGTPDVDGVYRGKRVSAKQFVEGCEGNGFAQCDVLFGWDIAEEVMTGLDLAIGSADTGFADILLRPDLRTFRIVPWEPATAAVVCDAYTQAGDLVAQSPRTVLRRVIERARGMGFDPAMAVELEFRIFREDQESLRAKRYSDLRPLNPGYNCYSISHASMDDDVVGALRRNMDAYGIEVEGYNREHGEGMYEMNLRYDGALEAADRGMLFKSGAKEVLAQAGVVPTFMAKYSDEMDGCSGHIHQSLWREGANAFWDGAGEHHMSGTMRAYLGGALRTMPELFALYAPNVNSYKRYVPGVWAPLVPSWGEDNRTCALRLIDLGSPKGQRVEYRQTAADMNPFIAMAACLGAGLHGVEKGLALPPESRGDAGSDGPSRIPRTLREATDLLAQSKIARTLFGSEFVDHYVRTRDWEVRAYERAVTDWELERYFEVI